METHPYAWAFFVPFILVTTFTALNLFIGVVVSAMQAEVDAKKEDDAKATAPVAKAEPDLAVLVEEVRALRAELARLRAPAE
jgi:voltage-gated sodium channel